MKQSIKERNNFAPDYFSHTINKQRMLLIKNGMLQGFDVMHINYGADISLMLPAQLFT